MQLTIGGAGGAPPRRSLASDARRGQIITAAIEVLAEHGYAQSTFARIKRKAGISSTRLISYHFGTKDELMDAVLADAAGSMQAAIAERTRSEKTAAGMLDARIEAELEWIAGHLSAVRAMYEVCMNARSEDGTLRFGVEATAQANVGQLEPILRAGQRSGEFRAFDTVLMALTLKAAVDAAIARMTCPPRLSLAECVRELTTLARLATRRGPDADRDRR
ncbi:TetR family transcriptional regulator [Actinocrinis puniceicyclus]|uniref:TetR family transcriptional regulator n=1 Tax=Actinocrinis puniceicyclus TaxID=977794 RepID=A0A8J7WNP8_9ACTN|nr:TetR/AcrR family transcriptional regulator [Actinocrinis puniceicyclus]MBS2965788.1 TetR family transcriptional regulator [Actinocrinis puniceicyclus]